MRLARDCCVPVAAGGLAAGAGLTAYAVWETRAFTPARGDRAAAAARPAEPLRVLHLSDIHLTPGQQRKQEWLRRAAALSTRTSWSTPATTSPTATPSPGCATRSGRCSTCPGSSCSAPTTTTRPRCATRCATSCPTTASGTPTAPSCPGASSRSCFTGSGWLDLTNQRDTLKVGETTFAFAGVDDPHLRYDRLDEVAGPADADADVRLGVAHAPYLRVLDQFAADGYDAILAGHTHGGQVCVPGVGALTTNCDLEPARAKGLHRHPARLAARRSGLGLAARLGRARHQPLRPDPGRLPPRGDLADPHLARLTPAVRDAIARGPSTARVCSPCLAWARPCGRVPSQGTFGLWRSLVARLVRDEEAAGSNPVSPTR